jgi:hypothetical protein
MKILVACEESQAVTKAFRKLNHAAYSCDIEPQSGGHPEWHLQQDVIPLLKDRWDMIVAFPPCTFLTVSGNRWFDIEKYGNQARQRYKDRRKAIDFFMLLANAKCEKISIENPVGTMSTVWRKPDQYIQPFEFGHPETKKTCLWLKGLSKLKPTKKVEPVFIIGKDKKRYSPTHYMSQWVNGVNRAKLRSKTFPGIAEAMANTWG